MLGSSGRRGCGPRSRRSETTRPHSPSQYNATAAMWPKPATHKDAFNFPDASRSLFDAVAEMTGLTPMVRELEARLAADVE